VLVPTSLGEVPVTLVLAGARVVKVQPDLAACTALAAAGEQQQQQQGCGSGDAAGGTGAPQAAAQQLAAEASESLQTGLQDGSIKLPLFDWF
jgi:hypothetical protein